jgi:hypothetical protein
MVLYGMNQIVLGEVWGCSKLHKAPITKDPKVKTTCNRTIANIEQTDEFIAWAKGKGMLCRRCFT